MKTNPKTSYQVLRFRRFDNKSYSAFRSLKREVNIGVLTFGMLVFVNVQEVSAQTENPMQEKEYELEEVEVTATRAPLTVSKAARMVTVLDREAIAAAPVQSVNDLLKYAIGVDVRQRGAQGMQTDISIRGGTFDQITILLNGANICDPQTGHNAADFPVDMNDIERIEILEGPAARVYGTSSLLGAINIVTRTDKESSAEFRVSGGSYGSFNGGTRVNFTKGKFSNQLSGSYNRSDGYLRNRLGRLNADFEAQRAYYQGSYIDPQVNVRWQAGFSNRDYASNTFYSAKYDDQFEHTRKYFTSVQAETKGRFHFTPTIYWTRGEDRFELIRGSEEKVPYNYHLTDVFGLNLNTYFTSALGKTALGGEMRSENISSTNIGELLDISRPIHGTVREYTKGLDRTNISFHLEHNVLLNRFSLSAGVMATKNTGNDDGFRFYPGVDAAYRLTDNWRVYASWNTSLRMPTFTELYYSTNETHQGNKHLKPEEMQAFEIGVKFLTPGIQGTLSAYHHNGTNMIDWVQAEGESIWKSINHTKVNSMGVEAGATFDLRTLMPGQNFLRRLYVGYSYINQDKKETPGYVSQYALEYLKHKFVAQLDHRIWCKLEANWAFRWQEREGSYKEYVDGQEAGVVGFRPYGVLDAKLVWNTPQYRFFVEANNLFDRVYHDHGNIPQPGIWVTAGANYHFKL